MIHILERFFIHFTASAFFVLAFFYALRYWLQRNAKVGVWLSCRNSHLLVTAALLVFALFTLREPWDVYAGNNSFTKSCFDQASWFIGAAVSAWGIYRVQKDGNNGN